MVGLLVVDDDVVMHGLFEAVFSYEPDIVLTMARANWESLPETHDWEVTDVVLSDQMLGNYRGSELLRWVEDNHPHIRRIMFTGDTSLTEKCAHADVVIYKPSSPTEIIAAVRGG